MTYRVSKQSDQFAVIAPNGEVWVSCPTRKAAADIVRMMNMNTAQLASFTGIGA